MPRATIATNRDPQIRERKIKPDPRPVVRYAFLFLGF